MVDGFDAYPAGQTWADGSSHSAWTADWNGYGVTRVDSVSGNKVLSLIPKPSTSPAETHSDLVQSSGSFGNIDLTVRIRTTAQLRTGSPPNPWEAAWVVWHLTPGSHFYYFVPKSNGWELGKEDPAYPGSQRFLATGSQPFPIGQWYTVRIVQTAAQITVYVGGTQLATFTDAQTPYLSGAVGLYTEDAAVQVDSVTAYAR